MPPVPDHSPRLYVDSSLEAGQRAKITPDQTHYLLHVMRLKAGDSLRLFNGRDGEWLAEIATVSKRALEITAVRQTKPQILEPDLWLCCAPIKKAHFDFVIEKATELGVSVIQPILTARTQVREVNTERARLLAIEAAEQSERLSIPVIQKPVALKDLAAKWPIERTLIVCAEWGDAAPVQNAFAGNKSAKAAIVTGPEGGFAGDELGLLKKIRNSVFIRLGPRILRADTAAIAALSCWQALCGDWNVESATKKTS